MKLQSNIKIPTLIYSRVSGYYTNVNGWNPGKIQEFKDRKYLKYGEMFESEITEPLLIK